LFLLADLCIYIVYQWWKLMKESSHPINLLMGKLHFRPCWFREAPLYISSKIPNVNPWVSRSFGVIIIGQFCNCLLNFRKFIIACMRAWEKLTSESKWEKKWALLL
jgi:hypothetical protein